MSAITRSLGVRDTRERKRLKGKEHVFDHMGSMELAANLFCATQTEEKLRGEHVRNKDYASRIHNEVGRSARLEGELTGVRKQMAKYLEELRIQ